MCLLDIDAVLKGIRRSLRAQQDVVRAEKEKAYLKSPYKFFGISLPVLRCMAKEFCKQYPGASAQEVFGLSGRLWASEYHQEKTLALMLLECREDLLDYDSLPFIEQILSECKGWDHADAAAIHLVGPVLMKDARGFDYLIKWGGARGLWLRRASLTSQVLLLRKGLGNTELLRSLASAMVQEREFFIRKAIGWSVRELAKYDPKAAFDMLSELKGLGASGLTLREGAKNLPEKMKHRLLGKTPSKKPARS